MSCFVAHIAIFEAIKLRVPSGHVLDVAEYTDAALVPRFLYILGVVILVHVDLLPNISLLHEEVKEFFLLRDQLVFVLVDHEGAHHQVIEPLEAALAGIELPLAVLHELRLCERFVRVLLVLTGLHGVRVEELFVLGVKKLDLFPCGTIDFPLAFTGATTLLMLLLDDKVVLELLRIYGGNQKLLDQRHGTSKEHCGAYHKGEGGSCYEVSVIRILDLLCIKLEDETKGDGSSDHARIRDKAGLSEGNLGFVTENPDEVEQADGAYDSCNDTD